MVVDAPDHDAIPRVVAADLVAVDDVDIVAEALEEDCELGGIILRIAVRVEDEILGRRREAGAQGVSVALVLRVVEDAQPRYQRRQLFQHGCGVIAAAVVGDDDFVVVGQPTQRSLRAQHHAGDRAGVVVRRKHRRRCSNCGQWGAAYHPIDFVVEVRDEPLPGNCLARSSPALPMARRRASSARETAHCLREFRRVGVHEKTGNLVQDGLARPAAVYGDHRLAARHRLHRREAPSPR